jgi:SAM-dependent methyltransferase
MAKSGEIDYLKNLVKLYGDHAISHAVGKPFSDPHCAAYLAEIAAILALLPPPPARLLDLGCGTGWTSFFFAKSGYEVTGVDIAPDMIHHASLRQAREGPEHLQFRTADYEELDGEATYDAVVFFDALHHAVDEGAAMRCAYRALKPGGRCIASEPGGRHSHSMGAVEAVRKFNVTEKNMPPLRIIGLGRAAGFRDFRVYPHAFRVHREVFRRQDGAPPDTTLARIGRVAARVVLWPWRVVYRSLRLAAWTQLACWANGITVLVK